MSPIVSSTYKFVYKQVIVCIIIMLSLSRKYSICHIRFMLDRSIFKAMSQYFIIINFANFSMKFQRHFRTFWRCRKKWFGTFPYNL